MATGNHFHYIKSICLILLLLFIFFLTPAPSAAQDPAPPVDRRFGVVDSFVNTSEATEARVGWTRIFLRWDVIQPGGPSDWKPANVPDPFIDAEVAAGREVVAVLIGTPTWATERGTSTAIPPLEYWGDFVYKVASQYKGRITHWIIWNQPDITDPASPGRTWEGSEADYYRLLKEAYQKIKAVDPTMQVHMAGLTHTDPQYLPRLLDQIVADPTAAQENYFFDAVSYHLYYDPVQILEVLKHVRSTLDAHGLGQKPIWINETNAPPSEDFIEPPTAAVPLKITLEEQANFVIQAFALALAGGAERIAINKMRNERSHPESVEPYGLLRGDDSRRPAFEAFRTAATYFAGVQEISWLQSETVYIVTLDRGGETTTVLWNAAPTPASYTLNAIASQALLVDERGNTQAVTAANGSYTIELPGAICSNGPNCFIGGAPRLVVETGSPTQRAPLLPLAQPTAPPAPPPAAEVVAPVVEAQAPPPAAPEVAAPTAEAQAPPALPTPAPVLVPTQEPVISPPTAIPASVSDPAPPPASILPDSSGDSPQLPELGLDPAAPVTATIVPPVTIFTVLRPDRLLWLFIIGLVVFTVSYGIQVAIWYRMKR